MNEINPYRASDEIVQAECADAGELSEGQRWLMATVVAVALSMASYLFGCLVSQLAH